MRQILPILWAKIPNIAAKIRVPKIIYTSEKQIDDVTFGGPILREISKVSKISKVPKV